MIKNRTNYHSNYLIEDFRSCKQSDFPETNLTDIDIEYRFCPPVESLLDKIYLRNHYANKKDRVSFMTNILKCYNVTEEVCS